MIRLRYLILVPLMCSQASPGVAQRQTSFLSLPGNDPVPHLEFSTSLSYQGLPPGTAAIPNSAGDHRWQGVTIGAVTLGIAAGAGGYTFCHNERETNQSCFYPTVLATVGGAIIGAVVGGIIGSLFPKDTTGPDSR
jgi:hypothetical protein